MADDRKIFELDDADLLSGHKIAGHISTEDEAEKIDVRSLLQRGYTQSGTVNNNSTLDIVIGNKLYDNWIGIDLVAYRGVALGYKKWRLEIINDNVSISTDNIYVQDRIGGSNFGLTFTNLSYNTNDIRLTLTADNRTDNITIVYKIDKINFTSTDGDFTIY